VVLPRALVLRAGALRALVERRVVVRRVVVGPRLATGVTSTVALAAAEAGVVEGVEAEAAAEDGEEDGVRALPEAGAPEVAALACSVAEDCGLVEAEERRRGAGVAIAREEGMGRRTRRWSAIHPASSGR
jgi:hypothetical protein